MVDFYRDTWAEIDLSAIQYNIKQTKERLNHQTEIFAVVKANAYGHGMIPVAQVALQNGASRLAVAFLDEALKLRKAGITAPILVLGASRPDNVQIAAENKITLTTFSPLWLQEAANFLTGEHVLDVHVKCDTGMGRLGIKTKDEIAEIVTIIDEQPLFFLEGVFTHFATADEIDTDYFQKQLDTFHTLLEAFDTLPPIIHCANSAAALRFTETTFNAVRLGIPMYGLAPSVEIEPLLPFLLKPAFTLHTKIVHVKKIHKGEQISYGRTYTAEQSEWIATLPIGYADGWIRKLSGQEVIVEGERVPIIGRICMDQCMIRLSRPLPVGTEVILIGKQSNEEITIDEIATKLQTINYEIPCLISSRVPRVYKVDKEIVQIDNPMF